MSAKDDWLDSESISDSWWYAMSPRRRREYQACESDHTRHYFRKQAFMDIFQYIHMGVIKAVAVQKRADGKEVDQVVYVDRRYFRNFDLFNSDNFTELAFAGDHFEDIRVKFPDDWTDAENYVSDRAEAASAPEKASDKFSEKISASRTRKPGKPSMKPRFIEAFRALKDQCDLTHGKRKDIDDKVRSYFRQKGYEVPDKRTVYKYIKEFRDDKLLI